MINFDNVVNARNTLNKEIKRLYPWLINILEGFDEEAHLNEFGFLRDTYVAEFDRLLAVSELTRYEVYSENINFELIYFIRVEVDYIDGFGKQRAASMTLPLTSTQYISAAHDEVEDLVTTFTSGQMQELYDEMIRLQSEAQQRMNRAHNIAQTIGVDIDG